MCTKTELSLCPGSNFCCCDKTSQQKSSLWGKAFILQECQAAVCQSRNSRQLVTEHPWTGVERNKHPWGLPPCCHLALSCLTHLGSPDEWKALLKASSLAPISNQIGFSGTWPQVNLIQTILPLKYFSQLIPGCDKLILKLSVTDCVSGNFKELKLNVLIRDVRIKLGVSSQNGQKKNFKCL